MPNMSWFSKLLDSVPSQDKFRSDEAACEDLLQYIPDSFTLKDLLANVEESIRNKKTKSTKVDDTQRRRLLQAILTCLLQTTKIQLVPDDDDESQSSAHALSLIISNLITPVISQINENDTNLAAAFNDNLSHSIATQTKRSLVLSEPGIKALAALTNNLTSSTSTQLDPDVLLTLISFADQPQAYTTPESAQLASKILTEQFNPASSKLRKQDFITQHVLQRYLRPLFSKSKPASVTSSGRKAAYPDQESQDNGRDGIPDDTAATKPWKFTDLRAVPVVAWAVTEADDSLISSSWPFYIPVLLTLTDDNSTPIRSRGLEILNAFLHKFPSATLHSTGLNKVFEDAIFPTLTYLPSLTPVDESVELLNPAYEALLTLVTKYSDPDLAKPRNALLDNIMRQGILEAHSHAKDHLRIVQVLNKQSVRLLNMMGIHAVKHLKDLIPSLVTTTLTDPFAPSSPETLLSAIKTLQAVLTNCWPRIASEQHHQDQILNALVLCWLNSSSTPEVRKELITSANLLSAVLATRETDFLRQIASPLIEKEPSLAQLFSTDSIPDSGEQQ